MRQTHINRFNRWSSVFKHSDISTNEVVAERVANTTDDLAVGILSDSELGNSPLIRKSWTFKVENLCKWIGVGICLHNTMNNSQYRFS